MKKIVILFILSLFIICPIFNVGGVFVSADGKPAENYVVYDENGEVICEKSSIELGDGFITADFNEYEIVRIDNHKGYAKLVRRLKPPSIRHEKDIKKDKMAQRGQLEKKICLYMTHNDESYTPTDGYDSVYGAGGIHDIAKSFKNELGKNGIEVVLDETLHIPHNSSAYSRSSVTANRLLKDERPDAMFDVHRDGVSKSYYYVTNNGEGYSKIRIVVGKSNPNFDENFAFAQSVFAIGQEKYQFLFSDIYLGKGHYNQALQPTDLLFEMGTYLIEKEYVEKSLPLLADVVNTTLYSSMTDEEGDIIVDEVEKPDDRVPIIPPSDINKPSGSHNNENNQDINVSDQVTQKSNRSWIAALVLSAVVVMGLLIGGLALKKKENKGEKTKK